MLGSGLPLWIGAAASGAEATTSSSTSSTTTTTSSTTSSTTSTTTTAPPVSQNDFSGDSSCVAVYNFESLTNAGNFVASASSEFSDSFAAWRGFEGIATSNYWATTTAGVAPCWLAFSFGANYARVVTGYSVTAIATSSDGTAKDWTFDGYDGTDWHVLDTQSNQTGWSTSETRTFSFSNSTAYEAYRISISANNGRATTNCILRLYNGTANRSLKVGISENTTPVATVVDTKNGENMTAWGIAAAPVLDNVNYKEGSNSLDIESTDFQEAWRSDNLLGANFPMKAGSSNTSFSVCGWFKAESLGSPLRFIWSKAATYGTQGLEVADDGVLKFWVRKSGGFGSSVTSSTTVTAGQWYWFACTHDNTSGVRTIYVWDDTAETWDSDSASTGTPDVLSSYPFTIGAPFYSPLFMLHYDGLIDELVVFNRAISEEDAQAIKDGTFTGGTTTSSSTTTTTSSSSTTSSTTTAYPFEGGAEIWCDTTTGLSLYACRFANTGEVLLTDGSDQESWGAGGNDADDYDVAMTEIGSSGHYVAHFDEAGNIAAGVYPVVVYLQAGANPADADTAIANGVVHWDGTAEINLYTILRRLQRTVGMWR